MPLTDIHKRTYPGPNGAYVQAETAVLSDVTPLPVPYRALFIGTTGHVKVTMRDGGGVVTLRNIPSGTLLPVWVSMVWSTGTTATDIVGLV